MVSMIAAVSENGVIGQNNQLPWRLSSDLRRFRQLTMGHHLIVGRRTFESIGRSLPGRFMVVLTRKVDYRPAGVKTADSLAKALALALASADEQPFIGGGSALFQQALPHVDRIYLTTVHANIKGDSFFPDIDANLWEVRSTEWHPADTKNEYASTFEVLDRVTGVLFEKSTS